MTYGSKDNEEHRSPPPSPFSFDTEIPKASTDARVKLTFATPILTHRETMALEKHIIRGTWKHKSEDSDIRQHGKERNGFSPPPLPSGSPREDLKYRSMQAENAYDRHITRLRGQQRTV